MAIPPIEGILPACILLPPGDSVNLIFFRIKISTGVIKKPKKKEVTVARKIFIRKEF
jgi:hypothetical protein